MAETEPVPDPNSNEPSVQDPETEPQPEPSAAQAEPSEKEAAPAEPMETEEAPSEATAADGGESLKRDREEAAVGDDEEEEADAKKQKVEKEKEKEKPAEEDSGRVVLGSKGFGSSVEMFDYFYKLLHFWTPNIDVNKYEHAMLLELLKKGHSEPDQKVGVGIKAFQVRFHPRFRSRCFFLVREDESVDDFSFRKCVDHILPLPENMQVKHDVNKVLGGGRGGRGGGRGRGRGRGGGHGGKPRN